MRVLESIKELERLEGLALRTYQLANTRGHGTIPVVTEYRFRYSLELLVRGMARSPLGRELHRPEISDRILGLMEGLRRLLDLRIMQIEALWMTVAPAQPGRPIHVKALEPAVGISMTYTRACAVYAALTWDLSAKESRDQLLQGAQDTLAAAMIGDRMANWQADLEWDRRLVMALIARSHGDKTADTCLDAVDVPATSSTMRKDLLVFFQGILHPETPARG